MSENWNSIQSEIVKAVELIAPMNQLQGQNPVVQVLQEEMNARRQFLWYIGQTEPPKSRSRQARTTSTMYLISLIIRHSIFRLNLKVDSRIIDCRPIPQGIQSIHRSKRKFIGPLNIIEYADLAYAAIHRHSTPLVNVCLNAFFKPKKMIAHIMKALVNSEGHVFVKQDFFNAESIFTSMSYHVNLTVVNEQHGLMSYANIRKTRMFPGYRAKRHVFYHESHSQFLLPFCVRKDDWTIREFKRKAPIKSGIKLVVCLTEDSDENHALMKCAQRFIMANEGGFTEIVIRHHPSNTRFRSELLTRYQSLRRQDDLPELTPMQTVYLGTFSTVLFEAALYGHRVVLVNSPAIPEELTEIGVELYEN